MFSRKGRDILSENRSIAGRTIRALLALILALYLCVPWAPTTAQAVDSDSGALFFAQVQETTDLNALWQSSENGLDGSLTLTEGGAYFLSDDLTADGNLVINAEGQDVALLFEGHTLTVNGAGAARHKTMVSIEAARSVRFDGTSSSGTSALVSAGKLDVWAISSTATDCAVSANDLSITLASTSNAQRNLSTHCIRISSGSLVLDSCNVSMLMGNQALRSADLLSDNDPEVPSAVFATSDVTSVTLDGCNVTAEGVLGFGLDDIADTTTIGNVYSVYSQAQKTLIDGGSYKAVSLRGNATCVYASRLEVTADDKTAVSFEADAGQLATGVLSQEQGSVQLNAPMSFSVGDGFAGAAQAQALLRANVQSGFVFGDCAPLEAEMRYTALVMPDNSLSTANADGFYIGTVKEGTSSSQQASVMDALDDALGQAGSCVITSDASGIKFSLDTPKAIASVIDASGVMTYWSTLDAALDKLASSPGATLTLRKDAGDVVVNDADGVTIDLNGHTITSLNFAASTERGGLTVKNGTISGAKTAVTHSSPSPLSFEGVSIWASASNASACGVYAAASAGALSFSDSSRIDVMASQSFTTGNTAYGINMAGNGPQLSLDSTSVTVVTSSAGVAVYGLYSATAASVMNSSVEVAGATGTTCALSIGGSLYAKGSSLVATASGAATTVGGIWGRVSDPKATDIIVDSCTIKSSSGNQADDAICACLLGSTTETGTSSMAWTLSGANSFTSTNKMHFGYNLGAITLKSDFDLADTSDSPVVISQGQCDDNAGFVLADGVGSSKARAWAGLFEARQGSYYDGWHLLADADNGRLVWRSSSDAEGKGIVELSHNGSSTRYDSMSSALANAASGDTIRLLGDIAEQATYDIGQDNLILDLNGHKLTARAGNKATAGNALAGGVVRFTGTGTLRVSGGTLIMQVGAVTEPAAGATYQGIAVSGGGTLAVSEGATVEVDYTGSTSSVAVQRSVTLRAIALTNGHLDLQGNVQVNSAPSDGALGAKSCYGVFVQAAEGNQATVSMGKSATVQVNGATAEYNAKNTFYAESGSNTSSQAGPTGLREITVDPDVDAELYQAIQNQFVKSASFDNGSDRNTFGAGIYYAQAMVLDGGDAWFDGLKVWAFSDVVPEDDIGKIESIVPSHVFISSGYDELPDAYGIATSASSAGTATVEVKGQVEVHSTHGNAYALHADGSQTSTSWTCDGAQLSAEADKATHLFSRGTVDLRDFIDFTTQQSNKVAYSGFTTSKLVEFGYAQARAAVIKQGVSFTVEGATTLATDGVDAADFEAQSFNVGASFSLGGNNATCSIANESGSNAEGDVFAVASNGARVSASQFVDAYGACTAQLDSNGSVKWSQATSEPVVFKVGTAVVARYVNSTSIDASEPSALAVRPDDQRQSYTLVGWSTNPDENAMSGYVATDATITPTAGQVYYAVYQTGFTQVPVSFSNVHDGQGNLQQDIALTATYCQTVGEAIDAAGISVPAPADYEDADTGVVYRFAGWYPYSTSIPVSGLIYDSDQVRDLEITLSANGMVMGALNLRATYVATQPDQHLVKFRVDGYTSVCVVDDGQYPLYTNANNTNSNYVIPSKITTEAGKTFTFASWVDANSGEAYETILPRATADATYDADWSWKWSDVTLTFYYKLIDSETQMLVNNAVKVLQTTYEQTTQDAADSVVKIGSSLGYGGRTYTLEGWGVRATDTEPIYDADNPLPSVNSDDLTMTADYAKTYYGIYSTADHMVQVSFYDGSTLLGTASVMAADTSVNDAFAATGAATPTGTSATNSFLGWATSEGAGSALNGTSTKIESLASGAQETLSLYAVYGNLPSYTVNLRDADGEKVLYKLSVKKGQTVANTLAQAGVSVTAPTKTGSYFAGWVTAAGEYYNLDSEVTGSVNAYASYKQVSVTTQDAEDISATATIPYSSSSTWSMLDQVDSVTLSLAPRSTADTPLRSTTANNGYSILKSYDLRLFVSYSTGESEVVTGEFGTASLKIFVGTRFKNAKVRAFWMGDKNGAETVLNSAVKEIDDNGYITLSVGNYVVGDEDEGGNLSIAYIEGGSGGNKLKPDSDSSDDPGSNSEDESSDDDNDNKSVKVTGTSSLRSGGSSGGLSSSGGSGGLASSSGNGTSALGASNEASSLAKGSTDAAAADGLASQVEGADEEASPFAGWDSDAVVLILIVVAIIALIVRGLWKIFVVKPRREEAEAELPAMADQYTKGLNF